MKNEEEYKIYGRKRILKVALGILALILALGIAVAVGQSGGGKGLPVGTPPPPSGIDNLLPGVNSTPDEKNPPPFVINGVSIPFPPNATFGVVGDGLDARWTIERGKSLVVFGNHGPVGVTVQSEDAGDFAPTLHALDVLASLPVPSDKGQP